MAVCHQGITYTLLDILMPWTALMANEKTLRISQSQPCFLTLLIGVGVAYFN